MVLQQNKIDWLQTWQQAKGHLAYAIAVLSILGYAFSYHQKTQQELFTLHERIEEMRDKHTLEIFALDSRHDQEIRSRDAEIAKLNGKLDIAIETNSWLKRELDRCQSHQSRKEKFEYEDYEATLITSHPRRRG